ncbi:4-hydroxy-tetrahydrodipicolinate synthase [Mycobacterium sp. 663a-19]|uniref:4-hydroxy-tetrahydrodipicolinate synthase n=1 Tax=Mycobacterium sp. 663a-19 TaxID=2986148 RepID=UPI002D1F945E|nr:4-hydroxy-tetrahydrodipicolinate synthase [Mycobacterium sp. 663a-19]MEB3980089.1 4-hydroxy-tetrahydrodipicolinate synthase [Mycobacterium sp. 663a-19]
MITLAPEELRGSYPPIVTPFSDGRIDLGTYEKLVDFQIQSGSHGIVVAGTSGEPALLTVAERKELAATAIGAADGRLPVMVATGAPSLAETIELTRHAEDIGAAAVLVVTPAFTRPPQRGLVEFYEVVCRNTSKPVLLYHIPVRSAVSVTADSIEAIAERCDNFVGAKHASTDLAWVTDVLLRLGPQFRIFVGLEEVSLPMLAVGAAGMVNAVANVFPTPVAALYQAVHDDKLTEARRLHQLLWELNRSVFFDTNPIPVKYMMWQRGLLPTNEERLPMSPATPEVERRCDAVLAAAADL